MWVSINIYKPLKQGNEIAVTRGGSVLEIFKYERLLDFCYICGQLDHQELECDELVRLRKVWGKAKREYGPWMRKQWLFFGKNEGHKTCSMRSRASTQVRKGERQGKA